jgi:hypothetical protein
MAASRSSSAPSVKVRRTNGLPLRVYRSSRPRPSMLTISARAVCPFRCRARPGVDWLHVRRVEHRRNPSSQARPPTDHARRLPTPQRPTPCCVVDASRRYSDAIAESHSNSPCSTISCGVTAGASTGTVVTPCHDNRHVIRAPKISKLTRYRRCVAASSNPDNSRSSIIRCT